MVPRVKVSVGLFWPLMMKAVSPLGLTVLVTSSAWVGLVEAQHSARTDSRIRLETIDFEFMATLRVATQQKVPVIEQL